MVNIVKMAKEQNEKLQAYIVINRASTNPFLYKKIDSLKAFIEELQEDERRQQGGARNQEFMRRDIFKRVKNEHHIRMR